MKFWQRALVFALLGLGPEHGVFAAVVTRLRELVWTGIGLSLLWVQGEHLPKSPFEGPSSPPTPPA